MDLGVWESGDVGGVDDVMVSGYDGGGGGGSVMMVSWSVNVVGCVEKSGM